MALIIAGERSGVGKTTITLAMLSWLINKHKKVQSFKIGPDYIDPLFHYFITGNPCRNLDPILTSLDYVKWCFNYYNQQTEFSLIEGVMGLFDGLPYDNNPFYGSTAHIAKLLNLPVVLIIDCSKISVSVGAIVFGYINFDPDVRIVGIILNKVASEKHLAYLKEGLKFLSIPIVGILFREQNIELPSRHLGLIPVGEIKKNKQIFQQLLELVKINFNWNLLTPYLLNNEQNTKLEYYFNFTPVKKHLKIAVAWDDAFNFYYQDNLDILTKLGAEIIYFSPLKDQQLPQNIAGIYLGGGFPEMFAENLANNFNLKEDLLKKIAKKIPIYAECGGLMYLSKIIEDFEGKSWEMLGIFNNKAIMSNKLTLGYRQAKVLKNNCFANKNTLLQGHEFHRAKNSINSPTPLLEISDLYEQKIVSYQGWESSHIFSSYLHLHFANFIPQVKFFLQHCQDYLNSK